MSTGLREPTSGLATETPTATRRGARARLRKAKWDAQPTQPAEVLIASVGVCIPRAVLRRARELSAGRPVAVVSIARMYGSPLGMPNPGLLPSRTEMNEQLAVVSEAIDELERSGVEAWGQVATTRRDAKTIAHAARAHGVTHVLVVSPAVPRWRLIVEGDTARDVKRRIGTEAVVEGITV
jgi:hypothetical protein